ncbi:MAG: LysM peptidoglycan-binding domain-containing protein [Gemmatimonadaceae bacterium]|nr:LysM peptidoglycan-binding domain-containing protein [Gemmatimonadaceae bacterium]
MSMREQEGLYRSIRFLKRALIGTTIVVVGILLFGYFFFMRHADAPRAWTAADREIASGMLRYGEKVERKAKVFQRRASEYYRGSNGTLYATSERIIFVGVVPPSSNRGDDSPDVILTSEFPNDTTLDMDLKRLFLLSSHGVTITYPGKLKESFAAYPGETEALDSLVINVNRRLTAMQDTAAMERRLREAVAKLIRQPLYYRIRSGDALFVVARKFSTTPEKLREWNKLTGDRVRIGDTLLVKPGK